MLLTPEDIPASACTDDMGMVNTCAESICGISRILTKIREMRSMPVPMTCRTLEAAMIQRLMHRRGTTLVTCQAWRYR